MPEQLEPRKVKYLSPSGISKYRQDPEAFYSHYIAAVKAAGDPQTQPMSIGSAFDAYAKSYIHEKLFGKGFDPKYEFNAIFESQVEEHHRDWALIHGMYVFDKYQKSGALADLMLDLQQAINVPKFEIEVMGTIHGEREAHTMVKAGVVFLGKPDVFFINKAGAHVVIDWKVNGYCSNSPKSPSPGYVRLRQDRRRTGAHPDARLKMHNGVMINTAMCLEDVDMTWATQLSIYGWLLGCSIGEDFITGIDQICCSPTGAEFPDLRFAEHRLLVSKEFQYSVFELATDIWDRCHSDHFFREMSKEESQARCKMLDEAAAALQHLDPLFAEMTAAHSKYMPPKKKAAPDTQP